MVSKELLKFTILLSLLSIILAFLAIYVSLLSNFSMQSATTEKSKIYRGEVSKLPSAKDLDLEGFKKVDDVDVVLSGNFATLYLKAGCYQLKMTITDDQGFSIKDALNGKQFYRPLTHDLLIDILDMYNITPEFAKIVEFKNDTYYAKLILRRGRRISIFDCRPSDAVAIAVRANIPIYIHEDVLKERAEYLC